MQLSYKKLEIKKIGPSEKSPFIMSPMELKDYIEFEPKRIYFISNMAGATGSHCHKVEEELFIMMAGSCTAMIDRGYGIEEIPLVGPTDAIYVGNYVWHGFKDFSKDALFTAVSSTNYMPDRSDYIEDYAVYQQTIKDLNIEPSPKGAKNNIDE